MSTSGRVVLCTPPKADDLKMCRNRVGVLWIRRLGRDRQLFQNFNQRNVVRIAVNRTDATRDSPNVIDHGSISMSAVGTARDSLFRKRLGGLPPVKTALFETNDAWLGESNDCSV